MSLMEANVKPPFRGSRLDADHPENGVLIPCRFTRVAASTYGMLFAAVVDLIAALDPSVLERLARRQGRLGFSCVSRLRRNFRSCDPVIPTRSGWWVSGTAGEDHVWRWLRALCEAGDLKFGEDMRFPVK